MLRSHAGARRGLLGHRGRGGTAGGNDVDDGTTTLLSPVFDLSGGQDVQIGTGATTPTTPGRAPNQDYWVVDITNDGGQTWSAVENTLASDTTWQQVTFDAGDHFAEPGLVQLRFVASDLGEGSLVEAMVDDFTLVGVVPRSDGGARRTGDRPELRPGAEPPEPVQPPTEVRFTLEQGGPAQLQIFDTRGRLVRTLVNADLPAGQHQVTWRGDDDQGRAVASGVYFYKLQAGDHVASKRMLLVK